MSRLVIYYSQSITITITFENIQSITITFQNFKSITTVAALCNAHGQCDQIFVKVGDGRLRQ